jgi:hypothetical protein
MSPAGLRAAHQHIAICELCRARLSAPGQVALAHTAFERELSQADAEDEHLPYQQLSGYVDDELHEIDREIVESHLEICADCAAEVRDLRSFKADITSKEHATSKPPSRNERAGAGWHWWGRWPPGRRVAAAAGIVLILTAAGFLLRNKISQPDQAQLTQTPQASGAATPQNLPARATSPAPPELKPGGEPEKSSANNQVRPSPRPEQPSKGHIDAGKATSSAQIVAVLKDGDGLVTLDSRGHISGVAVGEHNTRRLLAAALRSQRLEQPSVLDRLIRQPGTQLGIDSERPSFALERPVGTVVQSERPAFSWRPLPGAASYNVSVFDTQLNEVARSETLTTTAWRPARALRRGAIYRWQVVAVKDGREVLLPSPTAPEAKFKVIEHRQAQALARARRRYANSHLALGVLYAQVGLLDEAETELQALADDNPDSTVARKLLQSLQAWRPAQRKPPQNSGDASPPEK